MSGVWTVQVTSRKRSMDLRRGHMFDIVRIPREATAVTSPIYRIPNAPVNAEFYNIFSLPQPLHSIVTPAPSLSNYRTWTKHLRLESSIYLFYCFFILFLLSTNYYYN